MTQDIERLVQCIASLIFALSPEVQTTTLEEDVAQAATLPNPFLLFRLGSAISFYRQE